MSRQEEKSSESEMTFFEHIDALRPHLVRGALAFFVLAVVAFISKHYIIDTILMGPMHVDFPTNRLLADMAKMFNLTGMGINAGNFNLINTSVAGQFNLHMNISMFTGLALAVPYLLWEIWQFIKLALTPKERRASRLFVFYVSLCFFTGLLFGYFVIVPMSLNFFTTYSASDAIKNMIDIKSYLGMVLNISIACGLLFQLPLLVYFLNRMGILSPQFMRRYRRHAIVIITLFSAIIAPPDIFSMVLMVLPMYGLYELSIFIAVRTNRKMEKREEAETGGRFHTRSTLPTGTEE